LTQTFGEDFWRKGAMRIQAKAVYDQAHPAMHYSFRIYGFTV